MIVIETNTEFYADATIDKINSLIDQTGKRSLLYIYSPDCAACQETKHAVAHISTAYAGNLPIATINALAEPDVWDAFALQTLPSFLIVGDGQAIAECSGNINFDGLVKFIESAEQAARAGVIRG